MRTEIDKTDLIYRTVVNRVLDMLVHRVNDPELGLEPSERNIDTCGRIVKVFMVLRAFVETQDISKNESMAENAFRTKDRTEVATTFDLSELEETESQYDQSCDRWSAKFARAQDEWAARAKEIRKAFLDEDVTVKSLIEANANAILSQAKGLEAVLFSCISPVQLFNLEKRFGFREELSNLRINNKEDVLRSGYYMAHPISVRRWMNDPVRFALENIDKSKPSEEHGTGEYENGKHETNLSALEVAVQNCKLATKNLEEVEKFITDRGYKIPRLGKAQTFFGVRVTGIPKAMRQDLFDLEYTLEEIKEHKGNLDDTRDPVRSTFLLWCCAGRKTWELGKKVVHELAEMREYEYHRMSMQSLYIVGSRLERRIVRHIEKSKSGADLVPLIEAAFPGRSSVKENEEFWDDNTRCFRAGSPSVDEMISQIENRPENPHGGPHTEYDWWRCIGPWS